MYLSRTSSRAEGLKSGGCTILFVSMPKARTVSPTDQPTLLVPDMPVSYEAAMQELERLVGQLESGALPLEQLLTGYQRGAALLQFCRDKLQAVEEQIQVLDNGTPKAWKPQ